LIVYLRVPRVTNTGSFNIGPGPIRGFGKALTRALRWSVDMAEKLSGEARKSALARLKGWRELAGARRHHQEIRVQRLQ